MLKDHALVLDTAAKNAQSVPQISLSTPFNIDEAYEIQRLSLAEREARGENIIGVKMGFTSKAKMEQMGVHDLIWGRLTNAMEVKNGGSLSMDQLIHPRVEPEICFRLSKRVNWPIDISELPQVVDGICSALEVIDSRYENFKFSLEDVVADNCSSAAFVLGEWRSIEGMDLSNLSMKMSINGEVRADGSSNAIMGNPWESLLAAIRLGDQYNQPLEAGAIVLAGAATPAVYLEKDQRIEIEVEGLESAGFSMH